MSRLIRVGLASFGMSGQVFHGPSLKVNSNFEIRKILERSKRLSEKDYPEAIVVQSFKSILDDSEIELVIVNTPDYLHFEMCKQALVAGKNVVVEKPFTLSVKHANELIELARKKGLMLTVYQNRRWDGDFQTVKKVISENKLGRLVEFESGFYRFRNSIREGSWKEEGDEKRGVLYNIGSHMVDQALLLFGMPKSVTAHLAVLRDNGKARDYYDIRLQYDQFAAILKCSYLMCEPGPRYRVHGILGSFQKWGLDPQEDALKAGGFPNEKGWGSDNSEFWGSIKTEKDGISNTVKVETIPGNYAAYYENIYDALVNGAELKVKPEESRDGLIVLEACLQSHNEKRTVFL